MLWATRGYGSGFPLRIGSDSVGLEEHAGSYVYGHKHTHARAQTSAYTDKRTHVLADTYARTSTHTRARVTM